MRLRQSQANPTVCLRLLAGRPDIPMGIGSNLRDALM